MRILEAPLPKSNPPLVGIAQAPPCMTTRAGRPLSETECISCGQCTVFCPTGAIKEVDHTPRVMRALMDPEMVCVLQTAPSVRVTIAEMFGGKPGDCSEGRLVGAAKAAGFRFVFDTNLSADLTIMEEANELLQRIDIAQNGTDAEKKAKPLPMFTSCCPGWYVLLSLLVLRSRMLRTVFDSPLHLTTLACLGVAIILQDQLGRTVVSGTYSSLVVVPFTNGNDVQHYSSSLVASTDQHFVSTWQKVTECRRRTKSRSFETLCRRSHALHGTYCSTPSLREGKTRTAFGRKLKGGSLTHSLTRTYILYSSFFFGTGQKGRNGSTAIQNV